MCSVTQSCPVLCHTMGYSLQGSSVHGIFQTRILIELSFPPPGIFLTWGQNPHLLCLTFNNPLQLCPIERLPSLLNFSFFLKSSLHLLFTYSHLLITPQPSYSLASDQNFQTSGKFLWKMTSKIAQLSIPMYILGSFPYFNISPAFLTICLLLKILSFLRLTDITIFEFNPYLSASFLLSSRGNSLFISLSFFFFLECIVTFI